jgi:hypothetical protein
MIDRPALNARTAPLRIKTIDLAALGAKTTVLVPDPIFSRYIAQSSNFWIKEGGFSGLSQIAQFLGGNPPLRPVILPDRPIFGLKRAGLVDCCSLPNFWVKTRPYGLLYCPIVQFLD